jgi:antitoxin (DNA-binding transcriptional repressor) of toxin-antitoxin stability system
MIDAEAPSGNRREQMVASFNRGYSGFEQTYRICTPGGVIAALLPHQPDQLRCRPTLSILGAAASLKTNERARTEAQLHRRRTEQSDGPEKLYCKRSHGQLIISEGPVWGK